MPAELRDGQGGRRYKSITPADQKAATGILNMCPDCPQFPNPCGGMQDKVARLNRILTPKELEKFKKQASCL